MRRVVGTLAFCTVGIAACDHATEPDPCAGVAQEGELALAIFSTAGTFGTGDSATGVVVGRERGDAVITARAPALGLSASHEIAVRVRGAGGP
jgi:hypothetical protein